MYYNTPQDFSGLVEMMIDLLSLVVPFIFTLTFLFLAWKIIDAWILHGGESGSVEEGKKYATVGIIVLVVMSGVWGILRLIRASFFGF